MARPGIRVFKVRVKYKDDAHEPQTIAVSLNPKIKTAEDAEKHCLAVLQHYDRQIDESYPCIEAIRVRDEPFDISEAPMTSGAAEAIRSQSVEVV
jgi:hypothetical protein